MHSTAESAFLSDQASTIVLYGIYIHIEKSILNELNLFMRSRSIFFNSRIYDGKRSGSNGTIVDWFQHYCEQYQFTLSDSIRWAEHRLLRHNFNDKLVKPGILLNARMIFFCVDSVFDALTFKMCRDFT